MKNKCKKVQLEISSKNINCNDIVELLYKHKISSSVKSNATVYCNDKLFKKCWIEKGCSTTLYNVKPKQIKQLWNDIKEKTGVFCSHISIINKNDNEFNGCIHKFLDQKPKP